MKKLNRVYFKKFNSKSVLFNIGLWLSTFVILLLAFTNIGYPKKIDFIYTLSFLVSLSIPVIINIYFLIPKLLIREKYVAYLLIFIANLIVFAQLNIWFFDRIINFLFPNYYFISYHSNTKRITIFSIFLIGFTLIKLTQDWIFLNKKENKDLVQKNEEISNQLYFLRSQINPHFLFNSLNVIYNLSLEKSNETPKAIIQLSDILRYIIYDSETNTVSLKDEVKLIKNYIAFQSLRYQLDNYVTFNWTILNEEFKIFPMLFIPFIENCFKHGISDKIEETKINIELIQEENYCLLKLENKYDKPDFKTANQFSGVGIANVKKNLALVYPKAHELNISHSETRFRVTLKLFDYAN